MLPVRTASSFSSSPPFLDRIRQLAVAACAIAAAGSVVAAQRSSTPADPVRVGATATGTSPTLLPAVARSGFSSAIGRDDTSFHATTERSRIHLNDTGRDVSAEFTPAGVTYRTAGYRWSLQLTGYGYGAASVRTHPVAPSVEANRVDYARGPLTEWYVNGPAGIQQGFTLSEAPGTADGRPLTIALSMSGDLTPSVEANKRSLVLRSGEAPVLRYAGLAAWDANGRELRTWLEVTGRELHLRVDDAGAAYPVTIDPYMEAVKLSSRVPCQFGGTCDDGEAGNLFGYSLAMSGDGRTAVVGVPYKLVNGVQGGAVYVFVRPADMFGGWSSITPIYFAAKLVASDSATASLQVGISVAISADGSTVAAGAPGRFNGTTTPSGNAYVWTRPVGGWGSPSVQTEVAKLRATRPTNVDHKGSFGRSIAISGSGGTILVGVPDHTVDGETRGAAYVFQRPAIGWVAASETQKFPGLRQSLVGTAVALSDDGTIAVVGRPGHNPTAVDPNNAGAADVHGLGVGGVPTLYGFLSRLHASDARPYDLLGYSVSANADGSVIVAGAPVSGLDPTRAGAAYVFKRPATGWGSPNFNVTEAAKLTASDGYASDSFGASVNVSHDGSTVLVGAPHRAIGSGANGYGAAYLFGMPAAGWTAMTETSRLQPAESMFGESFGFATGLSGSGTSAIVGKPFAAVGTRTNQGVAHVFTGSLASPAAVVSPGNLTFGLRAIGSSSEAQNVTLANTGTAPLVVAGVSATGQFTSTQNCLAASPLAPGSSCTESLVYAPTTTGTHTGTLTFTNNSGGDPGVTQQVALQGSARKASTTTTILPLASPVFPGSYVSVGFGVAAEPGVALSPFGTVTVEASTGESCTSGVVSGGCSLLFASTGDRTITATFNGNVNFDPSTSAPVTLRVADFTLSASPALATVAGRKASFTLNAVGLNGFTGPVSMSCAGGPAGSTCAIAPASLTLTAAGAKAKATVSLPSGAASGSYTVTFTATFGGLTRTATATLVVK